MPTIVRIVGWQARGLRCPDHDLVAERGISFEKRQGEVHPVTLIQMPNGTGKTTTLELLRATLSGSAREWTPDYVRTLRKQDDKVEEGQFTVQLLHNGRRVTIDLRLDFVEGTVRYSTTAGGGHEEGFHPPHELRKFLRPGFIKFFVFDGELADHLLNHTRTDAQLAIEDLYQLTVFGELESAVKEYWDAETRNRGAKEEKGLNRRRNRVDLLRTRLAKMEDDQRRCRETFDAAAAELDSKDRRFSQAISQQKEFRDRLTVAEDSLEKAKRQVDQAKRDVLDHMRNPQALSVVFAREMVTLKDSLDRVKLPESAAREFFHELAAETHCICGRELDESTRASLLARAQQYLGSENVSLLNTIKKDITDFVGSELDAAERELKRRIHELRQAMRSEEVLRLERDRIRTEASKNDPELERAKEEIGQLQQRKAAIERDLHKYDDASDTAGDEDTFGIVVLRRRLATAETKLSEVTHTLELKEKRDVLISVLERAHELARERIGGEVCREANARIADLMPFNKIRLLTVNRSLKLEGQEAGSVGENLCVAYAFLSTLFDRSEHRLPFIVDSPANPIDLAVRAKVGQLVPKLTGQFVAFTISSEREGFLDALEKAAAGKVQFITMFRRGPAELEARAKKEKARQQTADGICIVGREFFRDFHRDEEGNDGV